MRCLKTRHWRRWIGLRLWLTGLGPRYYCHAAMLASRPGGPGIRRRPVLGAAAIFGHLKRPMKRHWGMRRIRFGVGENSHPLQPRRHRMEPGERRALQTPVRINPPHQAPKLPGQSAKTRNIPAPKAQIPDAKPCHKCPRQKQGRIAEAGLTGIYGPGPASREYFLRKMSSLFGLGNRATVSSVLFTIATR